MGKGKINILIVEDSRWYKDRIEADLKEANFNAVPASDGEEAIKILSDGKTKIGLIITDLLMPNVDGAEIAKINYQKYHHPIIVITGTGDAKVAINLLQYGVQDFLIKPFERTQFISVVKNAIARNLLEKSGAGRSLEFEGNVGSMVIHSTGSELQRASAWLVKRLGKKLDNKNSVILVGYLNEFLQNAFEHGSLGITEIEKGAMLDEGKFRAELKKLEIKCRKKIVIHFSILEKEVAVKISDEGEGFNYNKYLNMTPEDILERLTLPNGRGIYMAKSYFNNIKYTNNGASVTLYKTFSD